MSGNVTALVVAVAGREIEAQVKQRLDDREQDLQRASLLDRRESYIALHTAAWNFRFALKNCLFEDHAGVADQPEEARTSFFTAYRSAQIIVPDLVVGAAVPVYDALTEAYGRIKPVITTSTGDREVLQRFLNSGVEGTHSEAAWRHALGSRYLRNSTGTAGGEDCRPRCINDRLAA